MENPSLPAGAPDVYQPPAAEIKLPPEQQLGSLSPAAMRLLSQSRWGMKVVAVALMLNGVLALVAAAMVTASALPGGRKWLVLIVLLVLAFILFVPGLRLMQSARGVSRSLHSGEERHICASLDRHQQFWAWFGIVLILVAALLFFLAGVLRL